ncbi:MAG: hypothetical protein ACREQM_15515 [Candidatus Dormibacteraceae bacterium]
MRLQHSVAAGLAGTAAESLLTLAQTASRGRSSIYDPAEMAGRLAQRWLDLPLGAGQRRWIGRLMRWSYGPGWAVLFGVIAGRRRMGPTWPAWGLCLGAAVLAFELAALPPIGATPALRDWGADEVGLDALNAVVFGLVVAATLRALRSRQQAG